MIKGIVLLATCVLLFSWVSPSFSKDDDPFKEKTERKAYNEEGDYLGTIKKEANKYVFYDKDTVSFKRVKKNLWRIYNMEKKKAGELKMSTDKFKLYDKRKKFTGFVINVKQRNDKTSGARKKNRHIKFRDEFEYVSTTTKSLAIEPEAARLYLYVMKEIQKEQ